MNKADAVIRELDVLVEHTRERGLFPYQLLELQSDIAAIRYTIGEHLVQAEQAMLLAKEANELEELRGVMKLRAMDSKMSNVEAEKQVKDKMEAQRQTYIRLKIDYERLKVKLQTSSDALVGIAQRIKHLESEAMTARMQRI